MESAKKNTVWIPHEVLLEQGRRVSYRHPKLRLVLIQFINSRHCFSFTQGQKDHKPFLIASTEVHNIGTTVQHSLMLVETCTIPMNFLRTTFQARGGHDQIPELVGEGPSQSQRNASKPQWPLFHSALWPGQDAKVCAASNAATSKGPRIAKTEQRPRQVSTGMPDAHAVPT